MKVGIVGATGLVGRELVGILEGSPLPIDRLLLYASERSDSREMDFRGTPHRVNSLSSSDPTEADILFLCVGEATSRPLVPKLLEAGCAVVDKSSAFRLAEGVPLVVTGVNEASIGESHLVANPNCSTIQLAITLEPIRRLFGLRRVVVSSYQSMSGAGFEPLRRLIEETRRMLEARDEELRSSVTPEGIAFNLIPRIGDLDRDGRSVEECKIAEETRKILGDPALQIHATAVRVPVLFGHSESVFVETLGEPDIFALKRGFRDTPTVRLVADEEVDKELTPVLARQVDKVLVGRIRREGEKALSYFNVADNLRIGAAINAHTIALRMVEAGVGARGG